MKSEAPSRARQLLVGPLAYSMFFVFGSVTSLNDVLMPKLKELFQLNYTEMTLVGAEVTIGSLLVNYLVQQSTLNLTPESAGKHLAFYWGGLLVGRLCGILVLRYLSASFLVIGSGIGAVILVLLSASSTGALAGWTLLAVGLCNSVMFPLIFDLTSRGLGEKTSEGSGLICVAIVGGAVVPLLTGGLADMTNLGTALIVPALCYVGITAFGWFARRHE